MRTPTSTTSCSSSRPSCRPSTCAARAPPAGWRHLARLHVRQRTRGELQPVQQLDPGTADELQTGDEGAPAVQQDIPTRTNEARRMTTSTESAQPPTPIARPLWRRLIGFNLLTAVLLGVGGGRGGRGAAGRSARVCPPLLPSGASVSLLFGRVCSSPGRG